MNREPFSILRHVETVGNSSSVPECLLGLLVRDAANPAHLTSHDMGYYQCYASWQFSGERTWTMVWLDWPMFWPKWLGNNLLHLLIVVCSDYQSSLSSSEPLSHPSSYASLISPKPFESASRIFIETFRSTIFRKYLVQLEVLVVVDKVVRMATEFKWSDRWETISGKLSRSGNRVEVSNLIGYS